jgi:hypothetical protein
MPLIDVGQPLRQGDPRWKDNPLPGSKGTTFGSHGCLLMCLTMLARVHHKDPTLSPVEVSEWVSRAGGWWHGLLMMSRAARSVQIVETSEGPFDEGVVFWEVSRGRPVIVGIDYKRGRSSRLSDADHFVVAVGITPGESLAFADPATGKIGVLPLVDPVYRDRSARWTEIRCYSGPTPKAGPARGES